jgi:regulatory protein
MDYINEQRYATAFAHDKFRFNKWGKLKISYGLRQKKISSEVIQQALDSLDEIDYEKTLLKLIESKQRSIKGTAAQQKAAVIRFALSRGFEYDKIQRMLR